MYVRKFKATDFKEFTPIENIQNDDPVFAQAIEDSKLAVTGVSNGVVIGCGGVHPINDFQGEVWLRLSDYCYTHPIGVLRWIKEGFKIIEQTFPFKQIDAVVLCEFVQSWRLLEHLGFVQTATKEYEGKQWKIYSKRVQE